LSEEETLCFMGGAMNEARSRVSPDLQEPAQVQEY
jgi:hypothetical protein